MNDYEKTIAKKDPVFKTETANGNVKKDPVLILSLRKWLQLVLLPLLIVSVLSISLILTVAYFSLYAELEANMEKRYAFLMTKQNLSATEIHGIMNEVRAELEAKMEKMYAILMTKQNFSGAEIHAIVNEVRAELEYKMEKKYEFLLAEQNLSAKEIHALANEARVAVTACVTSDQKFFDGVIRFSSVKFQVGINNIDTFKSSGKFVCEIPGLYYISAHIYTSTQGHAFSVKKNSITITTSASDSDGSYSSNPISTERYTIRVYYLSFNSRNVFLSVNNESQINCGVEGMSILFS